MDRKIYYEMGFTDPVLDLGERCVKEIKDRFEKIDEIAE